ncbi:MAG: hypothetical protein NCW75_00455 [Phycisphaera sp.]|nr:MAG: hypothetical protein NCW75_00455 [Phycisphaera sp.]
MSQRTSPSRLFIASSIALLAAVPSVRGQASPDRVVIDSELGRQLVTEVRFEEGRISYERGGQTQSMALDGSVVALVEPSGVAPRPRDSWIELADGQRFVGMPVYLSTAEAAAFEEATGDIGLAWSTPLLGTLRVPLDALRRIVLSENSTPAKYDELNDVLVLANGDRPRGLLERVWPDVVLDVDGQSRTFELTAISSITLANPDAEHAGSRVWLSDGSIVAANGIETVPDGVELDLGQPLGNDHQMLVPLTMNEVLAVAFESGGVRPLADLGTPKWTELAGWTLPPVVGDPNRILLGSSDVELVGPVAASWALPSGVRRVAIRARLRDDCRVWGDCGVTVRIGEVAELTERLHGERPEATFTIDVPAGMPFGELEVRVEEGQGGTIQDRVMLDGFVLLSNTTG